MNSGIAFSPSIRLGSTIDFALRSRFSGRTSGSTR